MSYLVTWTSPLREFSRPSLIFLMLFAYFVYIAHLTKFTHESSFFTENSLLWKNQKQKKVLDKKKKKKHLWIRLCSHFACAVASNPINSIEELLVVSRLKGSWHFLKRKLAKIIFIKNRICSALFWCIDLVSTTQQITQ